ncbi:MAG: amidohydrolase family protein [Rhizobiaceae bacterium]|nr:amidohydrolase family protein [Rhizobiaceae bacterium]
MTSLFIKNACIVDGTGTEPADPVNIAIENGKFTDVGKDVSFDAAETLDLKNAIVMPGLIDCHVHVLSTHANMAINMELPNSWVALKSAQIMKDMLMRGFTTVRDLAGADRGLQKAQEDGLMDAPRLVICGKALSQTGGHSDQRGPFHNRPMEPYLHKLGALGRICDGVPEVTRAAREEIKGGANFIKVMADGGVSSPTDPIGFFGFTMDELKAIVEVAKGSGTYVAAHLYDDNCITRALDAGIECVEHGNRMSDETITRIAKEGQFVVPTNITYDRLAKEGADYGLPPESVAKIEDVREAGLERLEKLYKAGITVGYGSDLIGGMHPHQSGEFTLRGQYLPADAVIRSATVDAAKVLRMEGEIGVIAAGAHADLIVVEGNPLDDLSLLTNQGAHMPLIMQGGMIKKNTH